MSIEPPFISATIRRDDGAVFECSVTGVFPAGFWDELLELAWRWGFGRDAE